MQESTSASNHLQYLELNGLPVFVEIIFQNYASGEAEAILMRSVPQKNECACMCMSRITFHQELGLTQAFFVHAFRTMMTCRSSSPCFLHPPILLTPFPKTLLYVMHQTYIRCWGYGHTILIVLLPLYTS